MPIHLYKLLPQIIKLKDKLASCGAPGNLEKWVGCIEDVANSTEEKIEGLSDLLDADQCDPMYLFYLSTFLGTPVGAGSDLTFSRWLVKTLAYFYKIKGTMPSWDKTWWWTLNEHYHAQELYKTIPNEICDRTRTPDYAHTIKSARYDVYLDTPSGRIWYTPTQAQPIAAKIESVRPIHVLLRLFCWHVDVVEQIEAVDSLAGTELVAAVEDQAQTPGAIVDYLYWCANTCQHECQTACEKVNTCQIISCTTAACQGATCQAGACQYGSCTVGACQYVGACMTVGCQYVSCTTAACQGVACMVASCQFVSCTTAGCQYVSCTAMGCQYGSCTVGTCQYGSCTTAACQYNPCEIGCETACQLFACQGALGCQVGLCQIGGCELGCQTGGCETGSTTPCWSFGCQATCLTSNTAVTTVWECTDKWVQVTPIPDAKDVEHLFPDCKALGNVQTLATAGVWIDGMGHSRQYKPTGSLKPTAKCPQGSGSWSLNTLVGVSNACATYVQPSVSINTPSGPQTVTITPNAEQAAAALASGQETWVDVAISGPLTSTGNISSTTGAAQVWVPAGPVPYKITTASSSPQGVPLIAAGTWDVAHPVALTDLGNGCVHVDDVYDVTFIYGNYYFNSHFARLRNVY